MPARLRLSWGMKTLKQFLLPVLESFEFAWQVIRYALIFVSAFFRQRASLGCEMVAIRSQLSFYEESIRQKRQPSCLHGHSALSRASSRHWRVRTTLERRTPRLLPAMLSDADPRADDQSHAHRPSSETLRPPAARARPTHRGPDHRHRSRRSSVDDAGVAPHRANRGGQCGRGGPDRAGTPTRGPHTATTRPETRGAAPARTGPGPRLWLHVVRRATAPCSRQPADPACPRSGPRMHPVAGTPAPAPACDHA